MVTLRSIQITLKLNLGKSKLVDVKELIAETKTNFRQ
jgi:hypothetical protein